MSRVVVTPDEKPLKPIEEQHTQVRRMVQNTIDFIYKNRTAGGPCTEEEIDLLAKCARLLNILREPVTPPGKEPNPGDLSDEDLKRIAAEKKKK